MSWVLTTSFVEQNNNLYLTELSRGFNDIGDAKAPALYLVGTCCYVDVIVITQGPTVGPKNKSSLALAALPLACSIPLPQL